jgi:hypothetical protein
MINYSILSPEVSEKRHAPILISGDNSQRKTALALYMCFYFAKLRGQEFDIKKDIYYNDISNLTDTLLTTRNQIKLIDEAYTNLSNLESSLPRVIELGTAMNAIRNRSHIVIFIYSRLNRATKLLLEAAQYWFHKPSAEHAVLVIKDKEFVGTDAWGVDDLLKAKTKGEKRHRLTHLPGYIETFEVPRIPDKIFNAYEEEKLKQQEEYQRLKMRIRESEATTQKILDSLKLEYHSPTPRFRLENLREYLMSKGISRSKSNEYAKKFKDSVLEEEMASAFDKRLKEATEEER